MDTITGVKETNWLGCKLTNEEVTARAKEVANLIGDRDRKEAERKAEDGKAKAEIKRHDAEICDLACQVRERTEWRNVDCEWERNETLQAAELIRSDTGEIIFSRPFNESEKQIRLFPEAADKVAE